MLKWHYCIIHYQHTVHVQLLSFSSASSSHPASNASTGRSPTHYSWWSSLLSKLVLQSSVLSYAATVWTFHKNWVFVQQLPLQLPFIHPPHLQQLVLAHLYHPPSQGLIVAKYGIWQQWFSGEYRDHICRFVRLFFPSFYLNSQPQTRPYFWPIICLSTFAYSTF